MHRALTFVVAIVSGCALVRAHSQSAVVTSAFDVVSIKPTQPGQRLPPGISIPFVYSNGGMRLTTPQVNAFTLLQTAFSSAERPIRVSQIIGAPPWTKTDMYDIEVRTSADVRRPGSNFGAMVRSMLEDRFKLESHVEGRPFPVYALVTAKPDRGLGAQLRPSSVDCEAVARAQQEAFERDKNAVIAAALVSTDRPVCGARLQRGGGGLTAGAITMRALAEYLNNASVGLDRIVVDETGLTGRFDVDLHWGPPSQPAPGDGMPLSDGPSIFTAVQEQLGLKLERREAPLDVLVIDHIEPPTAN